MGTSSNNLHIGQEVEIRVLDGESNLDPYFLGKRGIITGFEYEQDDGEGNITSSKYPVLVSIQENGELSEYSLSFEELSPVNPEEEVPYQEV